MITENQAGGICQSFGCSKTVDNQFFNVERVTRYNRINKNKRRYGTKVQVQWDMVQTWKNLYPAYPALGTCYNAANTELYFKEVEESQWKIVDTDAKWTNKGTWKFDAKPCKAYHFRFKLVGTDNDESECIFETAKTLEPLSKQESGNSGYIPSRPSISLNDVSSNTAEIVWNGTDCTEKYVVDIVHNDEEGEENTHQTEEMKAIDNVAQFSMTARNLKPCTTYEIDVFSFLGNGFSEAKKSFSTLPTMTLVKDLEITVTPQVQYVVVEWATFKIVSCIKKYKIETCHPVTSS